MAGPRPSASPPSPAPLRWRGRGDARQFRRPVGRGLLGLRRGGLGERGCFGREVLDRGGLGPAALGGLGRRAGEGVFLGGHEASPVLGVRGIRRRACRVHRSGQDSYLGLGRRIKLIRRESGDFGLSSSVLVWVAAEDSPTRSVTVTRNAAPPDSDAATRRPPPPFSARCPL